MTQELRFETVDLEKHWELLVAFSEESFRASNFPEEKVQELMNGDGQKKYREFLEGRITTFPEGTVFALLGDEIVAQLTIRHGPKETENYKMDEDEGYVNLFYVVPAYRGTFVADALHQYVVDYLTGKGCTWARLTMNKDNARAAAYYKKHGWVDDGPREEELGMRFMKRSF